MLKCVHNPSRRHCPVLPIPRKTICGLRLLRDEGQIGLNLSNHHVSLLFSLNLASSGSTAKKCERAGLNPTRIMPLTQQEAPADPFHLSLNAQHRSEHSIDKISGTDSVVRGSRMTDKMCDKKKEHVKAEPAKPTRLRPLAPGALVGREAHDRSTRHFQTQAPPAVAT